MTELINPITGPVEVEAQGSPEDRSFCLEAGGGGHYQIPTSLTEEGNGYQLSLDFFQSTDAQNRYGIGFQYSQSRNDGGDFYNDQDHTRGLLRLSRGRKKVLATDDRGREALAGVANQPIYIGAGVSGGAKKLELGSDNIISYSFVLRTSGRFGISLTPRAGIFTAVPFDAQDAEEISLLALQAGLDFRFLLLDNMTRPPKPGLYNYDVVDGVIRGGHRLAQSYGTAKAIAGPSALAQDYTENLFGEGATGSARLEDLGLIKLFSALGTANAENLDLQLQLRGSSGQRTGLIVSKVVYTGLALALTTQDNSATMPAHGTASGLGLIGALMATGMGLDRETQHEKTTDAKQNAARDFLIFRSLLNGAAFAAGWALREENAGSGVLQGSQQANMAAMSLPDPAETGVADAAASHHFVVEAEIGGGRYLGYQKTAYLTSKYLYTRMRLMGQTAPGVREGLDEITGRDPLVEGAKATAAASLGAAFQTGLLVISGGARTLLAYGDGPEPVPGVGAEEQVLLSLGDAVRFELGAGATQDYLNEKLRLGVNGVAGLRVSF